MRRPSALQVGSSLVMSMVALQGTAPERRDVVLPKRALCSRLHPASAFVSCGVIVGQPISRLTCEHTDAARERRTKRRSRALAMDNDSPDATGPSNLIVRGRSLPANVKRPDIEVPHGLPQPAEWIGSSAKEFAPNDVLGHPNMNQAKPFQIEDNEYNDSWLDSLWINIFSSRMAVAVDAEQERLQASAVVVRNESKKLARGEKRGQDNFGVSKERGGATMGGMDGWYTYEDYVALASNLQAGPPERQREVVRGILRSIFPSWFPAFYRTLFPPSKFSAQVNAFMCPPLFTWLVGESQLVEGDIDLRGVGGEPARTEVWRSTVKVERCRFLEASKCKGSCMNLCKLPTEAFFREDLGMPLRMTPDFDDLSCEFTFGQAATPVEDDPLMVEPCWIECLKSDKQPRSKQRACYTMPELPLTNPRRG